jgi:hypothetical protein
MADVRMSDVGFESKRIKIDGRRKKKSESRKREIR